MTRILLIHQAFVGPNEPGGTRHHELARFCVQRGIQFTIVASFLSYITGQATVAGKGLVSEMEIDGIRVLRTRAFPSLHRGFTWRVLSFLSFMLTSVWAGLRAGSVDLVMGTTPPIFQAVSAWLVAALRRRPFLLEVRDLWPAFAIDMGVLRQPVLIKLASWLESFLYARATHFLVNSPAYKDYLLHRGIPAARIAFIPNGVDVGMFSPDLDGATFRQAWTLGDRFVVTYAGALGLANDIPTLLAAAERLIDHPRIHFLLVGDGRERNRLEAMVKERKLSNVTFTGAVPKVQIPEVLAAANACVAILQDIPMFRTTYPNKVFDYMAAGRPTILAIDGVIRDVVEAAEGGLFVPPGNDAALADAVLFLAEHPEKARSMGASARAYVCGHFDRQRQAEAFVELVRQVAARG